jgi:hypothetical protein
MSQSIRMADMTCPRTAILAAIWRRALQQRVPPQIQLRKDLTAG